ncbi:hypothetical protein [Phycicoccus flavus]|uniref:ABC-2 type transport system permease protein n=1 Tax=Phycicoccus flavus TaxID=2502783 RepID=A0A8T6R3E7_9MICO|nr:hypothetical protein [Phycicoccus flavus]NHA68204.1 hypothetical protein [Phycicoccus flavus]
MTALVVRLRFRMWWTAMTRSSLHLVSSVVGIIAALAVVGLLGPALGLLGLRPPRVAALTVPIFTTATLMWVVLGLAAAGVDNVLDPARFAVLPLRARTLARGLLAAALTGVPALLLTLLAVAQCFSWAGTPRAVPAAVLGGVIGVLTAVLASRAVTTLLAGVMTSHAGRLVGASIVSLATLLPLALNLVAARGRRVDALFDLDARPVARAASWFPSGWGWALPLDVAEGRWSTAVVHLVLGVGLLVVLWTVWVRQLERMLTSPLTSSGGQRIGRGRILPVLLGSTPTGIVAARRVRAWYRDSRLVAIALRTAVLPVFFVLQAVITGSPGLAGTGVVTLAVFAGLTLMNDLAFDGEAWWLHVTTGLRGWEDRLGRAIASTLVFAPSVALTFAVSVWIGVIGEPLPWLAVVLASFLGALALAVGVGAYLPGTAPRTGGNPFAATSGGAAQGCLTALISFIGPVLLIAPVVVAAVLTRGHTAWGWAVVVFGGLYGLGLLVAGVVVGGRRLDARAPELLVQLGRAQF